MWLSCDTPFFLCHPSRPQPSCLCRTHTHTHTHQAWLGTPSPAPSRPYLHPLVRIHFAALDQVDGEGLLQGPQRHRGGLGRSRGRSRVIKSGRVQRWRGWGGVGWERCGFVAISGACPHPILYEEPAVFCRPGRSAYSAGSKRGVRRRAA